MFFIHTTLQSEISEAIESYSSGICLWNIGHDSNVKAVLLSNRAACYLRNPQTIHLCIDDCTEALEVVERDDTIRCKILFRRSKARFLLSEQKNSNNVLLLNEAAKDLLTLLSVDTGNKEAITLLQTVRAKHSLTKGTPMSQTLTELEKANDSKGREYQLNILLGLLTNDASTALEMGRRGGTLLLLNLGSTKSIQVLACACSNPLFVREFGTVLDQRRLVEMVQLDGDDIAFSALSVILRLVLYLDNVESLDDISLLDDMNIIQACSGGSLASQKLLSARLDVLSSWTALDRESVVQASTDIVVLTKKTESELRSMQPREVAAYKKTQYERLQRNRKWAKQRSLLFCEQGGLEALLSAAVNCEDHSLRKHVGIVVGRLMTSIQDKEDVEKVAKKYMGSDSVTIEEISDEKTEDQCSFDSLLTSMKRVQLTASLLLATPEVGAWALDQTKHELRDLIACVHPTALGVASETLTAAASVEKSRPIITALLNNGSLDSLLEHANRDIRSGAASAIAKLGLADKILSANEGEVIGLLQIAVELLNDAPENASEELLSMANKFGGISSTTSAFERGVEIISYLASKTQVKEELAHGFKSSHLATTTALEYLVDRASRQGAGESVSAYSLATIFSFMCVSSETLRREAFVGKEMTMEQYDELQKLGKTNEEKEAAPKEIDDSQAHVDERIRILAHANVPQALVKLKEGASETTMEQIVTALNRFATEVSVRGLLIQQGALSMCMKVEIGVRIIFCLRVLV